MTFQYLFSRVGLIAGASLFLFASPAKAFTFTTNLVPGSSDPTGDIWLDSVQLGDGTVVDDFILVKTAQLISNTPYTGGNTGAASVDRGDNASGINVENPNSFQIAQALGNTNLNNIIDTEDSGAFTMKLFFEDAFDQLFFWERGMNSKLRVQALDAAGNPFGNILTLNSANWNDAGYRIDTTEISGSNAPQKVGSLGVSLADLGLLNPINGIQLSATSSFSGPDFKVMAASSESVPEPATLAGIGLVAGTMALSRRRKASNHA